MPEFHLFLPQMRMTLDAIVERAQAAEGAGFIGMSGMDHLVPPLAPEHPMYEAMTTNMWLAAHTSRLKVGSLVLCDAFRHPAMLAREAVAIDNASGGRFELGIGSGSVEDEFAIFGMGPRAGARPHDPTGRDARGAPAALVGRELQLRGPVLHDHRGSTAPHAAGTHPDRGRRGGPTHDGARRRVRRLVELPAAPARQARRDALPCRRRAGSRRSRW